MTKDFRSFYQKLETGKREYETHLAETTLNATLNTQPFWKG
jgi:hypothetical protein